MHMCKCACLGICLWRIDIDVMCFLPSFSISYFERQSLTEHGIFSLSYTNKPVRPKNSLVSTTNIGTTGMLFHALFFT